MLLLLLFISIFVKLLTFSKLEKKVEQKNMGTVWWGGVNRHYSQMTFGCPSSPPKCSTGILVSWKIISVSERWAPGSRWVECKFKVHKDPRPFANQISGQFFFATCSRRERSQQKWWWKVRESTHKMAEAFRFRIYIKVDSGFNYYVEKFSPWTLGRWSNLTTLQ